MAMRPLTDLENQGDWNPQGLPPILRELQGLRISLVDGDEDGVAIAIPGMEAEDVIVQVCDMTGGANLEEAPANGLESITFPLTDTTGKKLLVVWFDKDGPA